MAVILGTGAHRYEVVDNWAKLPAGQEFNADVAAVGIDKQDRVYAFNRGKHPVIQLDKNGNMLQAWGEGTVVSSHGIRVDPEGNVTTYTYYAQRDPNGDGIIDNATGDPTTGGYLRQSTQDTTSS